MSENRKELKNGKKRPWPENCVWPKPLKDGEGYRWEADDVFGMATDEVIDELLEIKEYVDRLVEEGILNSDYTLNYDYDEFEADENDDGFEGWVPEIGEEYWNDNEFIVDALENDLTEHINLLKLPTPSPEDDIRFVIGYEFVNENILRQAFTRRAFALEHDTGDSEVLELIGDGVLDTVVTREIARQLTDAEEGIPSRPFRSSYDEGELSRIREHFTCGEYLASCCEKHGLDKYILYGTQESPSDAACEDAMEALLGAVAVDSHWDWAVLERVADKLLTIQLLNPHSLLRPGFYDTFNSWHQRKFGRMPKYDVSRGAPVKKGSDDYTFTCILRYSVPENDQGIWPEQIVTAQQDTRSRARELAAEMAYRFVMNHGLWMNMKDSGIEPSLEDSINQLQELYQKKYLEDRPDYTFKESDGDEWYCSCLCGGIEGRGRAKTKTMAKKKASFTVLVKLFKSAGICEEEWNQALLGMLQG